MTKGLQKLIVILFGVLVVCLILFGIYKIFFDKGTINAYFKREFVLTKMETAHIEDEVYVKLLGVSDERCKEEDCEGEGEMIAKILIINNHVLKYVELGTIIDKNINLKKLGYFLELIEINDNEEVTLKLSKLD